MFILMVTLYLVACIVVGYMGRKTLAGPIGFFIISLLTSPIIAVFFLLLSQRSQHYQGRLESGRNPVFSRNKQDQNTMDS